MTDVLQRLAAMGGVARAGALAGGGGARRRLAALVSCGLVVAHPGGCYSLPGADRDMVRALVARAHLTCVSAALVHGIAVLRPPDGTHVAVPHAHGSPGRRRTAAGALVVHRERAALLTAHPHPWAPIGGPPVVAPAEALARLLRCQDELTAIAAVDSAVNRRLCTLRDVEVLVEGPGRPRAGRLLQECDGSSQSPLESVARVALRRAGYRVVSNVHVAGVGFVDLLVEDTVVVELDGFGHHGDRRSFREDRRRDRELTAQGFLVLRFTWDDVVADPNGVVAAVGAALRAAPGRGGRPHEDQRPGGRAPSRGSAPGRGGRPH